MTEPRFFYIAHGRCSCQASTLNIQKTTNSGGHDFARVMNLPIIMNKRLTTLIANVADNLIPHKY